MVTIDERLLDATCVENIEENFNRVLAMIDGISGDEGALAALDARVTALEEAQDHSGDAQDPSGDAQEGGS